MTYRARTHKQLIARVPGRIQDYRVWKAYDPTTGTITWFARSN